MGVIGNSNYWNNLEWVNLIIKNKRKQPYSVSSKKFFIDKDLRTAHWVGHSLLKQLDYNDIFNGKPMIDDLEYELTGESKETSNNDNLAVDEEANVNEAFTAEAKASNDTKNDLKDEQITNLMKRK